MTKKDFYNKINGKYVVIENAENLKKEIKNDFLELLQDIKEFNTKNIIVLSDDTFTSENLKKDNIILKIVGV